MNQVIQLCGYSLFFFPLSKLFTRIDVKEEKKKGYFSPMSFHFHYVTWLLFSSSFFFFLSNSLVLLFFLFTFSFLLLCMLTFFLAFVFFFNNSVSTFFSEIYIASTVSVFIIAFTVVSHRIYICMFIWTGIIVSGAFFFFVSSF